MNLGFAAQLAVRTAIGLAALSEKKRMRKRFACASGPVRGGRSAMVVPTAIANYRGEESREGARFRPFSPSTIGIFVPLGAQRIIIPPASEARAIPASPYEKDFVWACR